jgi:hypothetical protein
MRGQAFAICCTAMIGAIITVSAASADTMVVDRGKISGLQTAIYQADHSGDFAAAVHTAQECIAISKGTAASVDDEGGNPFCVHYLSDALRDGRGVPRDEVRAFALAKYLAASDADGDAALDLAQGYLDGKATPRDPIEAAVILWRVEHGLWSFYSRFWGLCDDCADLRAHMKVLDARIAREMSPEEKHRAVLIALNRFPAIAERVKQRDGQVTALLGLGLLAALSLAGSLIWWWTRSRRSVHSSA